MGVPARRAARRRCPPGRPGSSTRRGSRLNGTATRSPPRDPSRHDEGDGARAIRSSCSPSTASTSSMPSKRRRPCIDASDGGDPGTAGPQARQRCEPPGSPPTGTGGRAGSDTIGARPGPRPPSGGGSRCATPRAAASSAIGRHRVVVRGLRADRAQRGEGAECVRPLPREADVQQRPRPRRRPRWLRLGARRAAARLDRTHRIRHALGRPGPRSRVPACRCGSRWGALGGWDRTDLLEVADLLHRVAGGARQPRRYASQTLHKHFNFTLEG